MVLPVISLTERDAFIALRSFLLGVVAEDTEVIRGQVNRVAEPAGDDFIVMWPIRQERLETNETTYYDNAFYAVITDTEMTVTQLLYDASPLAVGMVLADKDGWLLPGTEIVAQIGGNPGGIGLYTITPSQRFPARLLDDQGNTILDDQGNELIPEYKAIFAGIRADLVATQLTVQLDVHGASSADNVRVIDTLFRSEYSTDAFIASGYAVVPLYCDDARQIPFINSEQQYENRWVMEAHLQISPTVSTPQQFADELDITLVLIDHRPLRLPVYLLDDLGNIMLDDLGNPLVAG